MNYINEILTLNFTHIIIAVLIFGVFLLFRKLFTKYVLNVLSIFAKKTKNTFDDKLILIITEPTKVSFSIVGAYLALNYLNLVNPIVLSIFNSLFLFIIFWILYDSVMLFENQIKEFAKKFGTELHKEISAFIIKMLKIFLVAVGFSAILQIWNINISAFIASLGLGGLAFALAAKDTAANLFGGLTLLADKSMKIDDWIKVNNVEGVVEEIGLRTTKIRTFEQSLITVPNQILANTPVENFSRRGIRRIKFRVGLTYNTPANIIEKIVQEITSMLKSHNKIAQDATMLVRFDKFEDSNLSIFIYTFTSTANWSEYLQIKEDVNLKVISIVEKFGSEFAFPTQTLYLKKDENV